MARNKFNGVKVEFEIDAERLSNKTQKLMREINKKFHNNLMIYHMLGISEDQFLSDMFDKACEMQEKIKAQMK